MKRRVSTALGAIAAILLLDVLGSPPVDSAPPGPPTRLGFASGDD